MLNKNSGAPTIPDSIYGVTTKGFQNLNSKGNMESNERPNIKRIPFPPL